MTSNFRTGMSAADDYGRFFFQNSESTNTGAVSLGSDNVLRLSLSSDVVGGQILGLTTSTTSVSNAMSVSSDFNVGTTKFTVASATGNTAVAGTLDVTGDTSVTTFDSTGATSLATNGGVVNISKSGVMTTIKGTLNVDEAVTLDTTLDVTGDTSVTTFDSSGATSLATGGGAVNISKSGVMTTIKGTLNVDEAVTFDSTLGVTGLSTLSGGITASGGAIQMTGNDTSNLSMTADSEGDKTLTIAASNDGDGGGKLSMTADSTASDSIYFSSGGGAVFSLNTGLVINGSGDELTHDGYDLRVNAIGANSYVTLSDKRYKKNIKSYGNALSDISKIRGVTYNWRIEEFPGMGFQDTNEIGFIAQELEEVVPDLVHTGLSGYKTVQYDRLTAILVEAVKEQQQQINQLDKEVTSLAAIKGVERTHVIDTPVQVEQPEKVANFKKTTSRVKNLRQKKQHTKISK